MKRLRYGALVVGGLVVLSFALARVLIDGASVREAIGAHLEAVLGEPVALGEVDLSLLPLPAARIRDARIGTPDRPRLEAREIRVGVSLPALLLGRVVLRSLQVESPQLRLPPRGETSAPPAPFASRWHAERARDVELAITSLVVHEGALELGAERLEQIELSGGLDRTLGASFDFSARAPGGIVHFEDGRLEIEGLTGTPSQWTWTANVRVAELDLGALRERLNFRALWGKADGTLDAAGTGPSVARANLALESPDLEMRGGTLRLWGPTRCNAAYPAGTVDIDLTNAQIGAAQLLEKPAGVALHVSVREIAFEPAERRVGELRIESDALRASGELDLRSGAPLLDLDGGSLDLAALASAWSAPSWLPRSGRVDLEHLRLDGASLALRADGSFSQVLVMFPGDLEVKLAGPVFVDGSTFGTEGLRVELAGESLTTSLRYDWVSQQLQIGLVSEGARVRPLLEKIADFKDVTGRLYAHVELAGPLDWYSMKGKGEFDLVDGEWAGVSLAKLAERIMLEERVPPPDPPLRFRGRLEVDEDEVKVIEGIVEQEDAQAKLSGFVYLRDFTVDLDGELMLFSPDLREPLVLPILKVGGPLTAMSAAVGNGESEDVRRAEAAMVEEFRRAEREMRLKEREKRKQGGSPDG